MQLALSFPPLRPEVFSFSIGGMELALRWYALAYIAGILIGLWLLRLVLSRPALWPQATPPMTRDQAEAIVTWIILGVILGGRLGFVLFYQPAYYLAHPQDIVKVWHGGMSFHGGLIGVILACAAFSIRNRLPALSVADALALVTPPGLFLGRIANFINAELWGRPTHLPWGVIFPGEHAQDCGPGWPSPCARHPSQLYEAGLEGLALGAVLMCLAIKADALKTPGRVAGVFFLGYGLARFTVEFFRQADAQFLTVDNPYGHVIAGMTMGQMLSLPMVALGLGLLAVSRMRSAT